MVKVNALVFFEITLHTFLEKRKHWYLINDSFVNIYFESSTHNGLGAAIETKSKTASKSNSTIPSQIDCNESSEDETWIPTATTQRICSWSTTSVCGVL